ncbi:MAG: HEAT repeat domain-containing protein [Candidatus Sumerlaeota bacterium]|nr:HEAT repeat domain-containing protein [Candidatus Sumerlaeota bacterium]
MRRTTVLLLTILLMSGGSNLLWAAKPAAKADQKAGANANAKGAGKAAAAPAARNAARAGKNKAWDAPEPAVQLKGGETPEQMQKAYADAIKAMLPALGGDDQDTLMKLQATIHYASRSGAESERVGCCQAVAAAAATDIPLEAKFRLLNELAWVGKAEVVGIEAKLLDDKDAQIREKARCALERNPAPEAAIALRDALGKAADPAWQAALALALAAKKDAAGGPAIAKLLSGKDERAAAIALDALAAIGGSEATKAVTDAMRSGPEKLRPVAADACLKCASQLLADGKSAEAAALFKELSQPQQPRAIQLAAQRALLATGGGNSAPKVMELLASDNADARAIGLGQISKLDGAGRKQVIDGIAKLLAPMQITTLDSLAGLGEKAALPVALNFTASSDANMRLAGINAIGRLGDAANAPQLCQALAKANDAAERQPIESALGGLSGGAATDDAIIAAMKSSSGETKLSLITVLSKRESRAAVLALLAEASPSADVAIAKAAFKALSGLVKAEDAPALLEKLAALKKSNARNDAELAAMRALSGIENVGNRFEAVKTALSGASADTDARRSMLRLLPGCANEKSLEAVKAALKDPDLPIRDAAVRALAQWPDPAAWDALAGVYRAPEKENFRALALNGLTRLAQIENAKPTAALMDRYKALMADARTDDERKLILSALAGAADPAALQIALPLLSNAAIRAEVEQAVKDIAASIKGKDPQAASAALKQLQQAKP